MPKKGQFKLKRHHGYSVVLFIFGTVFPPLAVAARFGIGTDFFLNLILTICGYIPGHVHNFYIQNIRNNKNNRRTPKWAIRYGLISDDYLKKKKRKSEWANRYDERLPHSTYEGREVEDGQVPDPHDDASVRSGAERTGNGHNTLWTQEDESFYSNAGEENQGGRWHYPANFDDSEIVPDVSRKRRKKTSSSKSKPKRDRWERSEDAYAASAAAPPAPAKKRKSTRRRASEESVNNPEGPEDPLGAGYGRGREEGNGASYGSYAEPVQGQGGRSGGGGGGSGGGSSQDPLAHDF
ncbi:hypothetical protein CALVIDRAFT_474757 [Calocera viscosa TUFC12733]|uniref:Uncharacterized protein n=1 Tax=Calocera viscosa (strain TUFC12733) TaxID=1330018 RepID=A0A167RRW5_CALVF|nr:hypothetical protein CALVIDRAFT_474757 [Calocera viscosa TUFC12733]